MLIKRPYLRSTKQNKVAVFFLYKMKNNYMACLGGGKTDCHRTLHSSPIDTVYGNQNGLIFLQIAEFSFHPTYS